MTEHQSSNGALGASPSPKFDISSVLQALEIIHNPTTKNDVRRQASDWLEQLKNSRQAAEHGLSLSTDGAHSPLVRHFGLSLLGHVIRHEEHNLSSQENQQLRACIVGLGRNLQSSDISFIRNKIAELWVELAKRTWALDWFDMDEQLVQLWSQDLVHKDFVLTILENLSEDIFIRDDPIAILRGRDLNAALVEVFTSTSNFPGGIKVGERTHAMRCGQDGWLTNITQFLNGCLGEQKFAGNVRETVLKALAAIRSAYVWVMTPAVVSSSSLATVCNYLTHSDGEVVMAAVDALLSLYGRGRFEDVEVHALVHPLIQSDSVAVLRELYTRSIVSVDEIDSVQYVISKKLSELVSMLSDYICHAPPPDRNVLDVEPFLHFMTAMAEHESLIVSIPVVHSWVKLLEMPSWRKSSTVAQCIGPLLQISSQRLVQYDQIPEGNQEPVVIFVNEEIELFPERQGFYLNYRRFCSGVIEWICYAQLEDAMQAVIAKVDETLNEVELLERQFDPARYERVSMSVLRADAQFAMLDSAFRGFERWSLAHQEGSTEEQLQLGQRVRDHSKAWMLDMLSKRNFKDPQIRQRQIKTAVEMSNRALPKDTSFAFSVLEHILSSFMIGEPQHTVYLEAVGELHNYAANELRRLALQHADYFVTFYDQLQSKFSELINQLGGDDRLQIDLKSILFSIIQRANAVDYAQRLARLEDFVRPLASAWTSDELQANYGTFEAFARSQAFDKVAPYMEAIHAASYEDWSLVPYDGHGAQIQSEMSAGYFRLPLRETRILLSISTEKIDQDSDLHKMICTLWEPLIPAMLSHVLRLTSFNHRLHDPSSWPNTQASQLPVIRRILRDRYWQSGISSGSMNDFHLKIKSTKSSLEGFASSVRGRIRNNLEQCYSILHTLGRLGAKFYALQQVPEMIAEFVLDSATPLSPHHFSIMLQMLPKLIEECPPEHRQSFLTPILSSLLAQMDTKLSREWQNMTERKQTKHDEENLSDEMRDDSVLRQTTYKGVNIVSHWINPKREEQLGTKKSIVNGGYLSQTKQTMRDFILSNIMVLEKLLVFVTHALAFRDTKSCHTMIVAASRIVPAFSIEQHVDGNEGTQIREYIATEMLKTAITCLHDGYFADHQQHYAQLIATIWISYGLPTHVAATSSAPAHDRPPLTPTPRNLILSLPGMTEAKVDAAGHQLQHEGLAAKSKKLRAIILSLLEGVRGVRVSELGKIDTKMQQSKILEKYKQRENLGMQGVEDGMQPVNTEDGPDLGGVADMFGNPS